MASDQKNHNSGRMCVPPPRISRTEVRLAVTRTETARKRSLNFMVQKDFPSSFQMHGGRGGGRGQIWRTTGVDPNHVSLVVTSLSKWAIEQKSSHVSGN